MKAMEPMIETPAKQPLIDLPKGQAPETKVAITLSAQPFAHVNEVPMPVCWGLITASAAILILEIWNYLS
jgi:hypothetical protein